VLSIGNWLPRAVMRSSAGMFCWLDFARESGGGIVLFCRWPVGVVVVVVSVVVVVVVVVRAVPVVCCWWFVGDERESEASEWDDCSRVGGGSSAVVRWKFMLFKERQEK